MIGQQLQSDGEYHRAGKHTAIGHFEHLAIGSRLITGVGARENKQLPTACPHFFQIGAQLFHQSVIRCHGDHRHIIIDQRQRSVLQLTRGVSLRMDIGNLFELEGPLHGNGVINTPAQKERVVFVRKMMRQRLDASVVVEHRLGSVGHLLERGSHLTL